MRNFVLCNKGDSYVAKAYLLWLIIGVVLCSMTLLYGKKEEILFFPDTYRAEVAQVTLSDRKVLSQVTYVADVYFSEAEFYYLLSCKEGELFSLKELERALNYFFKKEKFSSIKFSYDYEKNNSIRIHFEFESFWTIRVVKFHDRILTKDSYRKLYSLNQGDIFNQQHHDLSIKNMLKKLYEEGYYNAIITSDYEYDTTTKMIVVHITPVKNRQFTISSAHLFFSAQDHDPSLEETKEHLSLLFSKALTTQGYSKNLIDQTTEKILNYVTAQGYWNAHVKVQESIDYDRDKVDVHALCSFDKKREFFFKGNVFFSDEELLKKLYFFNKTLSFLPPTLLAEELEECYRDKGFWDVCIEVQGDETPLTFVIKEGERVFIESVQIKHIQNESRCTNSDVSCMPQACFFEKKLFESSLRLLLNQYHAEGFFDAVCLAQEYVPLGEGNYRLIVVIDEKERSYITSLIVSGNESEVLIDKSFKEQIPGYTSLPDRVVPCSVAVIEKQRLWLQDYFKRSGDKEYGIESVLTRSVEHPQEVSVTWNVRSKKGAGVCGKVIVLGAIPVDFQLFKRELPLVTGAHWQDELLPLSFDRLKTWNIFESVVLFPSYNETAKVKDLLLKVSLDDPYELRVRGGVELQRFAKYFVLGDISWKGGGAFLIKNRFKKGDLLMGEVDISRGQRVVLLNYAQPTFFLLPLYVSVKGYSNRHQHPASVYSRDLVYEIRQN
ncbi:MAG: POTRA domain-containing protein, partial [Candidatus Babeliales bacterium]